MSTDRAPLASPARTVESVNRLAIEPLEPRLMLSADALLAEPMFVSGDLSLAGQSVVFDDLVVTGDLLIDAAETVTFRGNVAVGGQLIVHAGARIVFEQTLQLAGDLATLTADEIDFIAGPGSVSSAGDAVLILQPSSAETTVVLGDAADLPGQLDLTDDDLAAMAPGFARIVIGQDPAAGRVAVHSANLLDSVTITALAIDVLDSLAVADGAAIALTGGQVAVAGQLLAPGGSVAIDSTRLTRVAATGVIDVSDGPGGDAGRIRLWSDRLTRVEGALRARGGSDGGDGGFIEVSSAGGLALLGTVQTSASAGRDGVLLIDPKNVIIGNVHDDQPGNPGTPLAATDVDQFDDYAASTVNISVAQLLTWGDVIIQASNDITVSQAIAMNPGDSLTLQAGRSVLIQADITTSNQPLTIIANDPAANPVHREAGLAEITMDDGTELDAGSGDISLEIAVGDVDTEGAITIDRITTTGEVTLTSGGAILDAAAGDAQTDISAGTLNLVVRETDATVGAEGSPLQLDVNTLNAVTADGHLFLENDGQITLDTIDAGLGSFLLTVDNGAILAAAGAGANLAAGLVNLSIIHSPAAIGTLAEPLRTAVGVLSAATYDGGIYLSEADDVLIASAVARTAGLTPYADASGLVILDSTGAVGTSDVVITAGGDIVLAVVTAGNQASVTSTAGAILDGNEDATNLVARTLILTADGDIGHSGDALETGVETLTALSTTGSLYLSELDALTIADITVAGDATASSANGAIRVGTTAVAGRLTLQADGGAILDNNGAAANLAGGAATLIAKTGIGTSADPLETALAELDLTTTAANAPIFVTESDGLDSLAVTVKDSNVTVNFTGGPLTFVASTDLLNVTGPAGGDISFENTNGDVAVGLVDAGAGAVRIAASGAVRDDVNDAVIDVIGGTVTLVAGSAVAAAGNELDTAAADLVTVASAGGVFLRQTGAASLAATATGAVDVANTGGDMTLNRVAAGNAITLDSAGSILDGNAGTANLVGPSATLTAGGAIGAAGDALEATVDALSAVAAAGGVFIANSKALTVTTATATGGDLTLSAVGNLTIGAVTAAGQTVTLTATGAILDGNAAVNNITAAAAALAGSKIGTAVDPIETTVDSLDADASAGGIFLAEADALTLNHATALGSDSDIAISAGGDLTLGAVAAQGDDVSLTSATEIFDGNGAAVNVTARTLTIVAPDGIAVADPLELNVDQLDANGGAGGAGVVNTGALALTAGSLTGKGAAAVRYQAQSITVLDIAGDLAALDAGGSLVLETTTGHIVFLDLNDTIRTQGDGSISIRAGTTAGSGAMAIVGNLETDNQDIEVSADGNVVIGLLDAGTGEVTVTSSRGVIVDGNGAAANVIASLVTLSATTPTARQAQLITMWSIAEATATRGEAASKRASSDAFASASTVSAAAKAEADREVTTTTAATATAESAMNSAVSHADDLWLTATILNGVSAGLTIASDVVLVVASIAQAIPLTGDGGAFSVAAGVMVAADVAAAAAYGAQIAADVASNDAQEATSEWLAAAAEQYAAEQTAALATATANAFAESYSIALAAADKADIARDAAAVVAQWAIVAEDQGNAIGADGNSLVIQADAVDLAAAEGSVYVSVPGDFELGDASIVSPQGRIVIDAGGTITVTGTVSSPAGVSLIAGGDIVDGGGIIIGQSLTADAGGAVGTTADPIDTQVAELAASAAAGGVFINNSGAVTVTTLAGLAGVSAAGDVEIASTETITLAAPIAAAGFAVTLTSTNGAIADGHDGLDVTAASLDVTAATGIALDSAVDTLAAEVTASGDVAITELDAVTLSSVRTADGAIAVTAGGTITATVVSSLTDDDANDIALTSLGGDLALGEINAGTVAGDVTLWANGQIATAPGGRVTADALDAEADSGIDLTTSANSATLAVTGAGAIALAELDALTLDAQTANGPITATAGGNLAVTRAVSLTDDDANDIALTATGGGSLGLGEVDAGGSAGDVVLSAVTAGGTIAMLADGRVTADSLTGSADSGIALTTTAIDATLHVLAAGGITVDELDGLTLTNVDTANGPVAVVAGGTLNAADVASLTDDDANDIALTSLAGDIVVGLVGAGTIAGDVALDASAGVISTAPGGRATADVLTGVALSGITLATAANSLELDVTAPGDIVVDELDSVTLAHLATTGSDITVVAPGDLLLGEIDAAAGDGDVSLTAGGSIVAPGPADASPEIVAHFLQMAAGNAIGSLADRVETDVLAVEAQAGLGGIYLIDLADGLTVGGVAAGLAGLAATGGQINLTATGTLTLDESADNTDGSVVLAVLDNGGDDHLLLNASVSAGGAGGIALTSPDNVTLDAAASLSAGGAITITADQPDDDADAGSAIDLAGSVVGASLAISTGGDDDTVSIADATLANTTIDTGGGDDVVTVAAGVDLGGGAIDLGDGDDQLVLAGEADDVNGGDGDDLVTLKAGGRLAGTFDGGDGYDRLVYDIDGLDGDDVAGPVIVDLTIGAATNVAGLAGAEGFFGVGHADDRLVGPAGDQTWHISSPDAGDIGGAGAIDFAGFANLTGGADDDRFILAEGASLSGNLDGGGGENTIDFDTDGFAQAVAVALTAPRGGTATGIGGTFANIDRVVGDSDWADDNTISAGAGLNTWAWTSPTSGSIDGVFFYDNFANIDGGGGGDALDLSASGDWLIWRITGDDAGTVESANGTAGFTGMGELIGGNGPDTFIFSDSCILTVGVDGGLGEDTLDLEDYLSQNVWTTSGTDGMIETARGNFSFAGIDDIVGGLVTTYRFQAIDLTGAFGRIDLPAGFVASAGANGRVSLTITNDSNAKIDARVNVSFYLSADGQLDAGDTLVATANNQRVRLLPGRSRNCTVRANVPAGLAAGDYVLLAVIDSADQVVEANELNNAIVSGSTFQAIAPTQDLAAISCRTSLDGLLVEGDSGTVAVQVANLGNETVTTPVAVSFYLSLDGQIDGGDILLFTENAWTTNLRPGAMRTLQQRVDVPAGTPAGNYQVLARVDALNQVAEPDELNNDAAAVAALVVQPAVVDLAPGAGRVSLPATAVPGDRARFELTLDNLGTLPAAGVVDVQVYASLDDVLDAGDVLVGEALGRRINLAAGRSARLSISQTLADDLLPATYRWLVVVDSNNDLAESDEANNAAPIDATATELVWKFGNFDGRRNVQLRVTDGAGEAVTFSLTGGGVGSVIGGTSFDEIIIAGTTARSTVKVRSRQVVDAGLVQISEPIGRFIAPTLNLSGPITTNGLPRQFVTFNPDVATVAAGDALASEPGPADTATFTITRGGLANDLTVWFELLGEATWTQDYTLSAGGVPLTGTSVVIPDGADHVDIVLSAIDDLLVEPLETVTLRLLSGPGYTVGAAGSADAAVADND